MQYFVTVLFVKDYFSVDTLGLMMGVKTYNLHIQKNRSRLVVVNIKPLTINLCEITRKSRVFSTIHI